MNTDPLPELTVWDQLRDRLAEWESSAQSRGDAAARRADRLTRRSRSLREQREGSIVGEQRTCLLFLQGQSRYAVAVGSVLEVLPLDQIAPVPGAPDWIPGVIQRRGEILALLDLGKLFGAPQSGLSDLHISLIVEAGGRRCALAATDIEDVVPIPESQIQPAPLLGRELPGEWLIGVVGQDRLILNLDEILSDPRLREWRAGSTVRE